MDFKEQIAEQLRDAADNLMDAEFITGEKRRERDRLIIEARSRGLTLRTIGDICMISHQTIANIIERENGRRDAPDA